jgi:hypothetical protein
MTAALRGAGPSTPPRDDGGIGASGHRNRWPWLALAAIVLAVAGAAQTGPGRSLMSRLGLSAHPDHYTALSFTTPDALAEQTSDHLSASFAIANHEGAHRDYQWTAFVGEGDDRHALTTGTAGEADGDTVVVDPAPPNPCPINDGSGSPTRLRITVSLADPDQSIGFWLTCAAAGDTP